MAKIKQIIMAQPGWSVAEPTSEEVYTTPIACWALLDDDSVQPMIADSSDPYQFCLKLCATRWEAGIVPPGYTPDTWWETVGPVSSWMREDTAREDVFDEIAFSHRVSSALLRWFVDTDDDSKEIHAAAISLARNIRNPLWLFKIILSAIGRRVYWEVTGLYRRIVRWTITHTY